MIITIGEGRKSSLAVQLAVKLAEGGSGFFSPVSKDEAGVSLINYLVDRQVLFDPMMTNCSLSSAECYKAIESGNLVQSFEDNSDVFAIHTGGVSAHTAPSACEIVKALDEYEENPAVIYQPDLKNSDRFDSGAAESLLALTSVLLLTKEDLSVFPLSRMRSLVPHVVICDEGTVWYGPDFICRGSESFASLLDALHKRGCFGLTGQPPRLAIAENDVKEVIG